MQLELYDTVYLCGQKVGENILKAIPCPDLKTLTGTLTVQASDPPLSWWGSIKRDALEFPLLWIVLGVVIVLQLLSLWQNREIDDNIAGQGQYTPPTKYNLGQQQ